MGHIIADIATMNPRVRTEEILYHFLPSRNRFVICHQCGQQPTTELIHIPDKGDIHVILYPCTRVVVGIHPETRAAVEKESRKSISGFITSNNYYFCEQCVGWGIPELIAKAAPEIPEIQEGIDKGRDPIYDSNSGKIHDENKERGCWITVTEFRLGPGGRFLNLNLRTNFPGADFQSFVQILNRTKLFEKQLLSLLL